MAIVALARAQPLVSLSLSLLGGTASSNFQFQFDLGSLARNTTLARPLEWCFLRDCSNGAMRGGLSSSQRQPLAKCQPNWWPDLRSGFTLAANSH